MKDKSIDEMKFYLNGRLAYLKKEIEEIEAKPERMKDVCAYRKATNEGMLFEIESMLNFINHIENR